MSGCQAKCTASGTKTASSNRKERWALSNAFAWALTAPLFVLGLPRLFCGRGAVHQLDQRHRCVVALAEAELEDAQVAPVARLVARAQLVEELHDDVAVGQPVEGEAAVGERWILAERDDGLGDLAQLLRLRQRRLDRLVLEERHGHVAQHREAMAAGAVELAKPVAVTHFRFPFDSLGLFALIGIVVIGPRAIAATAALGVTTIS